MQGVVDPSAADLISAMDKLDPVSRQITSKQVVDLFLGR